MSNLNLITDETPAVRQQEGNEIRQLFLIDLKFEVVLLDSLDREFIEFKWPIMIVVRGDLMQVKFTIIEKDLRSYFPDAGAVAIRRRSVDERAILTRIRDQLHSNYSLQPLDINRGIKSLWGTGIYRLSRSALEEPKIDY